MTLRVAQFSLKIAHLSFSMVLRGPRACGLRPRLWLLSKPERERSGSVVSRQLIGVENEFRLHKAMHGDLSSCFQNIINT